MLWPFSYFFRRSAASLSRAAPVILAPFLIVTDLLLFAAALVSVATVPPLSRIPRHIGECSGLPSMIEHNRRVRHRWNDLRQLHQVEVVRGPVVLGAVGQQDDPFRLQRRDSPR